MTAASATSSRPAVGSSRRRMGALRTSARAMPTRRSCPLESPRPRSPRTWDAATSPSPTAARAAVTSASPASGAPSRTLSATVPANRYGACATQARHPRHASVSRSRTSIAVPSPAVTSTRPADGSSNPRMTARSVLLPAPLDPVIATTSPGRTRSEAPAGAATSRPGCRTERSSTASPSGPGGTGAPPRRASSGASMIANAAAAADSPSSDAWNSDPSRRSGR